jgi:predicted small secreted protein
MKIKIRKNIHLSVLILSILILSTFLLAGCGD